MTKKKALQTFLSIGLGLLGAGVVVVGWYPFYRWYLGLEYLPGVDFYLTATHIRQLLDNFNLPPLVWKYYWYSGYPFGQGYLTLHFYLAALFVKLLGLVRGVQTYAMASLLIFSGGSYLLFSRVSANKLLSAVLSVAVVYSASLYGALLWAGAIPSFATQAFLPLALFCLVSYFKTKNRRWFYCSGLTFGLSVLGHPLVFLIHILPMVIFFSGFYPYGKGEFLLGKRIKDGLLLFLIIVLVGIDQIYQLISTSLKLLLAATQATVSTATSTEGETVAQGRAFSGHPEMITAGTNLSILIALGVLAAVFVGLVIFWPRRVKNVARALNRLLPTALSLLFLVGYIYAFAGGFPIITSGWYRAFWPLPLMTALLVAQFWGEIHLLLSKIKPAVAHAVGLIPAAALAILVFSFSQGLTEKLQVYTHVRQDIYATVSSNKFGAYPFHLNTLFSDQELADLKPQLVPSWFDEVTKDYRLFELDATFNVWWNALFNTRQTLGYIDPPLAYEAQGYWFWMKQALTKEGLIDDWEKSYEQAINNSKFLIDWHSIGVIEAGCVEGRIYCIWLSNYLEKEAVVDPVEEVKLPSGELFKYYRVKPEYTSPILQPTNATNVLVVSDEEGYEHLIRALAYRNIDSKQLILVRDSQLLDKYTVSELKRFRGVILYNYDYRNYKKAWDFLLDKYVKNEGGKVFIDTGAEVEESESESLPSLFPMKKNSWGSLGKKWDLEGDYLADLFNLKLFSPPVYDDNPWKFSYVDDDKDLYSESRVIIRNHGKPVLVERSYGKGKVIWSGLNLPYHLNRNDNFEEAKLLEEIISMISGYKEAVVVGNQVGEYSGELGHRRSFIKGETTPVGFLLREQAFPGWQAKMKTTGRAKELKIYRAGPITPGYIYVTTPELMEGEPYEVEFKYRGGWQVWFFFLVSLVAIIWVVEKSLISGKITRIGGRALFSKMTKKIVDQWEDEEL